jgi:SNF2 family DNA or RNA helicase
MPPSVTLAQYQSASHAIEFTYASLTIFMSPCTSYSNYEQAIGRTLRHGQSKTALFYHLAIENSLDKRIWSILSKKEDFTTKLIETWYKTIDNDYN